jgi:hypothetical protein
VDLNALVDRFGAGSAEPIHLGKSLSGDLNSQYGGPPAARRFVDAYGGDPDDPCIAYYIDLDNSDDF